MIEGKLEWGNWIWKAEIGMVGLRVQVVRSSVVGTYVGTVHM